MILAAWRSLPMRLHLLGLVLLGLPILLAHPALAQEPLAPNPPTLLIVPSAAAILPQTPVWIPTLLRVPCGATDASPDGIDVEYAVDRAPVWASLAWGAARQHLDAAPCDGSPRELRDGVTVSVTSGAPAFWPAMLELRATITHPLQGPQRVSSSAPIVAGFAPALRVTVGQDAPSVAPGERAIVMIHVENLGNANTKISFDARSDDASLQVVTPSAIVLQSRATGGAQTEADVALSVVRSATFASQEPARIVVEYESHYALDSKLSGDRGTLAFTILPRAAPDAAQDTPLKTVPATTAPLGGLVIAIVAVVLGRR